MTHGEGQNFIKQIAEAYAALEREQGLLDEIDRLKSASVADGERIARLEIKLQQAHNDADALQAKLRSVEAERDDAGFRLLEAEDRIAAWERLVGAFTVDVGALIKAGKPEEVKAEPVPLASVPSASTSSPPVEAPYTGSTSSNEVSGERAVDPTPPQSGGSGTTEIVHGFEHTTPAEHPNPTTDPSPGQSAPLPTVNLPSGNSSPNVPTGNVETQADASEPKAVEGPYTGKSYFDWPYFVTLEGWLRGGGTRESYFGSPAVSSASHYS